MANAAFHKNETLFNSKMRRNLREKLVKRYIWSIALYGDETWTLRKVDQKYLENVLKKNGTISWTDRVRNEKVQNSQRGE
jgi:hypothetical protein